MKSIKSIKYSISAILCIFCLCTVFVSTAYAAPLKVKKIRISQTANQQIQLHWKKVKKAKYYQIKIITKKNKKYSLIRKIKTKKNITKKIVKKLKAEKKYYFRIRTFRNGKYGPYSKRIKAIRQRAQNQEEVVVVPELPEEEEEVIELPAEPNKIITPDEPIIPEEPEDPVIPDDPIEIGEDIFREDFSSYEMIRDCYTSGEHFGDWELVFSGYGCVAVSEERLAQQPQISTEAGETHASLVIGPKYSTDINYEVSVYTAQQLRENDAANSWEVAWVLWHYTDNDHFYYFIPKPNGWELGKRDPDYEGGQRFLATGSDVLFPIQTWYNVRIEQIENLIKVYVDEQLLVEFTDEEESYTGGQIGLYNEDAQVYFDDIKVIY